MSVSSKALWYIESHLAGDLSLDAIAAVVGVSRFHLCRAFAVSAGRSLAKYARARRLSEAARSLVNGAPDILSVALDSGYNSHEAFTHAFRQHFGLPPEQLRAQAHLEGIQLQEPISMNNTTVTVLAPPRILRSEALLIFGLAEHHSQSNAGMASQWSRFLPYFGQIEGQIGNIAYGVICNSDDACSCDYICGVAVNEFPAHPPNFTRLRVPPQTYAVFEHRDHVSSISGTWKAIWERGLADAGCQAADGPALERYCEQFDGRTGLGGLELWIPVT